jgi:asparagine synthase (glutamine-hydrolysing)
MCGIYGQVRFHESPDRDACLRRLALVGHRGPDHQGTFFEARVFLGHARLSILDPEPVAHQPFGTGAGNGTGTQARRLVYNGEVYNFRALRDDCPGVAWKTRSDTEVLFELLQARGEACLSSLNGMFAFAYWDEASSSLLLARDRAGIKPLYYALDGGGLEFASEIKAFERTGLRNGEGADALKEVLARGHTGDSDLPFPGVRELEPGTCLRVDVATGRCVVTHFASLAGLVIPARMAALRSQGMGSLQAGLEERLEASVDLHLQSDAPLASLCSGGVDSTLLSALALRRRKDVRLYHCGVEGPGGEEAFARRAAAHLSAELVVERMRPEIFLELMPEVTRHLDLPVYHPNDMGLYLIARRAHRDGVKVLLCGEGADELFGGYTWQRDLARMLRGRARLAALGKTAERGARRLRALWDLWLGNPRFTPGETARFAAAGLCYPAPGVERVYKGQALFSENFRAWKRWDECLQAYAHLSAVEAPVQALMLDNMQGHLGTILHRTDRILMAHSIEGRVPFLENSLFEYGLNLPLEAKIHRGRGKVLLKALARKHLPADIVDRPKAGFPVPWERYLPAKPLLIEDGFLSEWTGLNARQLHAFHEGDPALRFRLMALEIWGRLFAFGETPASIKVR